MRGLIPSGIVLALQLLAAGAAAQESAVPAAAPAAADGKAVSTKSLEDLVATIEDPERRAALVEKLRSLIEVQKGDAAASRPPAGAGLIGALGTFFGGLSADVRSTAIQLLEQLSRVPAQIRALVARLDDPAARNYLLLQAGKGLGIIVISILAGIAAWIPLRRVRARITAGRPGGRLPLFSRIWRLPILAVIQLLPIAAMVLAAMAGFTVLRLSNEARAISLAIILAISFQRVFTTLVECVLASRSPSLRIFPIADSRATALASSLGRISAFAVIGHFTLQTLRDLGAEPVIVAPLRSLYGLILLGCGIALVLRERGPTRTYLLSLFEGRAPGVGGGWRSAVISIFGLWWLAAIVYMIGVYMVWASGVEGGFRFIVSATVKTFLAIVITLAVTALLRRLTSRIQSGSAGLVSRYPEIQARIPQYAGAFGVLLRAAVIVLAACFCLEAWGLAGLDVFATPAAKDVLSAIVGVLVVILLAAATIDVATVFTQRYLESRERAGRATGKVRTLAPLTRKAIRAVVMIVAAMMILGQLGVEIAPMLAGVGVLGLAIGFGAQTLVKDIITGFFMLIEDTLSVGDQVQINDTSGTVEAINIRTLRMRDVSGNVHTIPYSSVTTVINMSKDFSRYVIDAAVAYGEDVDEVSAVLREVGEELRQDPQFGGEILEPIEIVGLERFDESAVVVRARLLTKPSQQFRIGREFNRRMKKAFDQRGIALPFPTRTVYLNEVKNGSAPRPSIVVSEEEPAKEPAQEVAQEAG